MAIIIIESDSELALTGFKAGVEFVNDGSITITDDDNHYITLQDEDGDDNVTYTLDSDTGFLSLKHTGVEI